MRRNSNVGLHYRMEAGDKFLSELKSSQLDLVQLTLLVSVPQWIRSNGVVAYLSFGRGGGGGGRGKMGLPAAAPA